MPEMTWLKSTRPEPLKPETIPAEAQWLSGEGAGSFFHIIAGDDELWIITRYAPDGVVECRSNFTCNSDNAFDINLPFRFDYLSHCREVTIQQNGKIFRFVRVEKR